MPAFTLQTESRQMHLSERPAPAPVVDQAKVDAARYRRYLARPWGAVNPVDARIAKRFANCQTMEMR